MGQVLGLGINATTEIILVVVVLAVAIGLRLYMMRRPGTMRAKCPKCGTVFDASHSFSGIHVGPFKVLQCPSCGKSSFMNAYSKDAATWPPQETTQKDPKY
jgi:predicted Zn finger-like uncharacterized protein